MELKVIEDILSDIIEISQGRLVVSPTARGEVKVSNCDAISHSETQD